MAERENEISSSGKSRAYRFLSELRQDLTDEERREILERKVTDVFGDIREYLKTFREDQPDQVDRGHINDKIREAEVLASKGGLADDSTKRILRHFSDMLQEVDPKDIEDLLNKIEPYFKGESIEDESGEIKQEFIQMLLSLREYSPEVVERLMTDLSQVDSVSANDQETARRELMRRAQRSLYLRSDKFKQMLVEAGEMFTESALREDGIIKEEQGVLLVDKRELKRRVTEHVYRAVSDLHRNRTVSFREAPEVGEVSAYIDMLSQWMEENFNRLANNYFQNDRDTQDFLRYMSREYPRLLFRLAGTFHEIPILANNPNAIENLPKIVGAISPEEMSVFFDDPSSPMNIARYVISNYLRTRLVKEGNHIPPDLFSGEYDEESMLYNQPDIEEIKRRVRYTAEKALGRRLEDWELEMSVTYGLAIGLITFVDTEIIVSADPRESPEGIFPLAAISPAHNWGLGRGGRYATPFEALYTMTVPSHVEENKFRDGNLLQRIVYKLFKNFIIRRWIPEDVYNRAKEKSIGFKEIMADNVWGIHLQYPELIRLLGVPMSVLSRGGWRVNGHKDYIMGIIRQNRNNPAFSSFFNDKGEIMATDQWNDEAWEKFFVLSIQEIGMASMWWWYSDYDVKNQDAVIDEYCRDRNLSDREKHRFKEMIKKEGAYKPLFEIRVGGRKEKVSYFMLTEYGRWIRNGRLFEIYAKRNPGDFFLILTQMVPDVLSNKDLFSTREELSARGYDSKKIDEILKKRDDLEAIWGVDNYAVLRNVSRWFHEKIVPYYSSRYNLDEDPDAWQKIVDLYTQDMFLAYQVRLRKIRKEGRALHSFSDIQLKPEDLREVNSDLVELVFGRGGFFNFFPFGSQSGFGDPENFFAKMAHVWERKEGETNPFGADIDMERLLKHFDKARAEDVLLRLSNDQIAVYKDLIGKLQKFSSLLTSVAITGNLDQIIEMHKEIKSFLQNIMGKEYAYRANYLLASMVIGFFVEHSSTRMPLGLINRLIRPFFGKNLSLSKLILGDPEAFSMDNEALNKYITKLERLKILGVQGPFSGEALRLSWGYDLPKISIDKAAAISQAAVILMFLSILLTMWKQVKEEQKK